MKFFPEQFPEQFSVNVEPTGEIVLTIFSTIFIYRRKKQFFEKFPEKIILSYPGLPEKNFLKFF
jgi:hypothetical protein